ncbi:hypothetical protein PIB30_068958 [Stylosanthes scabra]|uniref:Core Histone H2A/H2B/H3 domain-containing protein n=1 Tax=Stylosanthes scabra TaxID=79078 RepID=A0ABU6SNG3_9FABA|nr:hypothetical protein [Stylosanthes scabra]
MNFNSTHSSSSSASPPNSMPMPRYPLPQDTQEDKEKLALEQFWYQQFTNIQSKEATRQQLLPVRVKKIMKADQSNKITISSEAPLLLAKACEVLIEELTFRALIRAESNKRRTLQLSDIVMAIKKDKLLNNFFSTLANNSSHHHHHFLHSKEMVLRNQEFAPQNQYETIHQDSYQSFNNDQLFNMMQYYLPSEMMKQLPQFLPLSNQPNSIHSDEMMKYMAYDHDHHHQQFQTMQQPHYYLPSNDAFPYNYFHPK